MPSRRTAAPPRRPSFRTAVPTSRRTSDEPPHCRASVRPSHGAALPQPPPLLLPRNQAAAPPGLRFAAPHCRRTGKPPRRRPIKPPLLPRRQIILPMLPLLFLQQLPSCRTTEPARNRAAVLACRRVLLRLVDRTSRHLPQLQPKQFPACHRRFGPRARQTNPVAKGDVPHRSRPIFFVRQFVRQKTRARTTPKISTF
jgi:hypothetical protein